MATATATASPRQLLNSIRGLADDRDCDAAIRHVKADAWHPIGNYNPDLGDLIIEGYTQWRPQYRRDGTEVWLRPGCALLICREGEADEIWFSTERY